MTRQMHLNAFLMSCGHHEAAWRLPGSDPFANTDLAHWANLARIAERGTSGGKSRAGHSRGLRFRPCPLRRRPSRSDNRRKDAAKPGEPVPQAMRRCQAEHGAVW